MNSSSGFRSDVTARVTGLRPTAIGVPARGLIQVSWPSLVEVPAHAAVLPRTARSTDALMSDDEQRLRTCGPPIE